MSTCSLFQDPGTAEETAPCQGGAEIGSGDYLAAWGIWSVKSADLGLPGVHELGRGSDLGQWRGSQMRNEPQPITPRMVSVGSVN